MEWLGKKILARKNAFLEIAAIARAKNGGSHLLKVNKMDIKSTGKYVLDIELKCFCLLVF